LTLDLKDVEVKYEGINMDGVTNFSNLAGDIFVPSNSKTFFGFGGNAVSKSSILYYDGHITAYPDGTAALTLIVNVVLHD
jgi:hypothetical protein